MWLILIASRYIFIVCVSGSASRYLQSILVFAESDTLHNFRKDKTASSIINLTVLTNTYLIHRDTIDIHPYTSPITCVNMLPK